MSQQASSCTSPQLQAPVLAVGENRCLGVGAGEVLISALSGTCSTVGVALPLAELSVRKQQVALREGYLLTFPTPNYSMVGGGGGRD